LGDYERSFGIGAKIDFLEELSFFPGIGGAISVGKDFGLGVIILLCRNDILNGEKYKNPYLKK
jgi:hypothetical protein